MIGSRGPQPRRSRRSPRTPERPARQDARAGEASPSTSGEFQDRGGCRTQRRRREPKRDSARLPGSGLPEPCRNGCRENLVRRGAARPYRSRRPGSRGSPRSRGRRSRNSRPRRPRARPAPIGSHRAGVLPDRIDGLALRPGGGRRPDTPLRGGSGRNRRRARGAPVGMRCPGRCGPSSRRAPCPGFPTTARGSVRSRRFPPPGGGAPQDPRDLESRPTDPSSGGRTSRRRSGGAPRAVVPVMNCRCQSCGRKASRRLTACGGTRVSAESGEAPG